MFSPVDNHKHASWLPACGSPFWLVVFVTDKNPGSSLLYCYTSIISINSIGEC